MLQAGAVCWEITEFGLCWRVVAEAQGRLMGLSELLWTRFLGLYIPQCAFNTDLSLANKLYFRLDAELTVLI